MSNMYRNGKVLSMWGNLSGRIVKEWIRRKGREVVYLEHLGMMDDVQYVEKWLYKQNAYEKNGIILGVNLFITYETGKKPLDTKGLDILIKQRFLSE